MGEAWSTIIGDSGDNDAALCRAGEVGRSASFGADATSRGDITTTEARKAFLSTRARGFPNDKVDDDDEDDVLVRFAVFRTSGSGFKCFTTTSGSMFEYFASTSGSAALVFTDKSNGNSTGAVSPVLGLSISLSDMFIVFSIVMIYKNIVITSVPVPVKNMSY